MIFITNRFVLILEGGEVFRVYAPNEKVGVNIFLNACRRYSDTDNDEYVEYWNKLIELVNNGTYTIIKCDDFIGIEKI